MTVAVVAVIAAFLALILRKTHPEYALSVSLIAGVLILAVVFGTAAPIFTDVQDMLMQSGLPTDYVRLLFKALGICLLTQFAADACRDAGEQGLASKAEFAGKLMLLTLALPLFRQIGDVALALIGKG